MNQWVKLYQINRILMSDKFKAFLPHHAVACLWHELARHFKASVTYDSGKLELCVLPDNAELGHGFLTPHQTKCGIKFYIFTSFDKGFTIVALPNERLMEIESPDDRASFFTRDNSIQCHPSGVVSATGLISFDCKPTKVLALFVVCALPSWGRHRHPARGSGGSGQPSPPPLCVLRFH